MWNEQIRKLMKVKQLSKTYKTSINQHIKCMDLFQKNDGIHNALQEKLQNWYPLRKKKQGRPPTTQLQGVTREGRSTANGPWWVFKTHQINRDCCQFKAYSVQIHKFLKIAAQFYKKFNNCKICKYFTYIWIQ